MSGHLWTIQLGGRRDANFRDGFGYIHRLFTADDLVGVLAGAKIYFDLNV